ncbi:MAG: ribosomal RNA small subunit methyltransferase A [Candidatus Verstraetearchaeota archaeon]|nr:ribosomal RNA small subunit methyltransferase A [Candidatus Verstraetearchaeota archaeon]
MYLQRITRRILEELKIKPSRRRGQHFVVSEELVETMIAAAELSQDDVVLEIGAGLGTLTERLAEKAGKVLAVEVDRRMARYLEEKFKGSNVEVIHADILKIPLPPADKVVSNLPFSISTPITIKLLKESAFRRAVLTYQKEVALRIAALPGSRDYGRLSVLVQLLTEPKLLRVFPSHAFYPQPEVDVAVVCLDRRERPLVNDVEILEETTQKLFSQRNRVLRKALKIALQLDERSLTKVLQRIPREFAMKRVYELSPLEIAEIASVLRTVGVLS